MGFSVALERARELDSYYQKHGRPVGPLHGLPSGCLHTTDDTAFVSQSKNVTTPLSHEEPVITPPGNSSSSSLVIITPQHDSVSTSPSRSTSFDTRGITSVDSVTPEQLQLYHEVANVNGGPCSNSWGLSQWVSTLRRIVP